MNPHSIRSSHSILSDGHSRVINEGWEFEPLAVKGDGVPLAKAGLPDDEELIVFERGGLRRAFSLREMAYHHLAQGELDGEPYMVSF